MRMRRVLLIVVIVASSVGFAHAEDGMNSSAPQAYEVPTYSEGPAAYVHGPIHPPTVNANGIVQTAVAYPFYRGFYSYNRFYGHRTSGNLAGYRPNYTRGLQDGYWLPAGRRWGAH